MTARISAHFGDRVDISESYGDTTADVAPADWIALLTYARDNLGQQLSLGVRFSGLLLEEDNQ